MKYKLSEEELDQMIRDAAVDAYGDEEIFMSILHTLEIMLEAADRSFRGYPRHFIIKPGRFQNTHASASVYNLPIDCAGSSLLNASRCNPSHTPRLILAHPEPEPSHPHRCNLTGSRSYSCR